MLDEDISVEQKLREKLPKYLHERNAEKKFFRRKDHDATKIFKRGRK